MVVLPVVTFASFCICLRHTAKHEAYTIHFSAIPVLIYHLLKLNFNADLVCIAHSCRNFKDMIGVFVVAY